MFLSKENPNHASIRATIAELSGEEVALQRIDGAEFGALHQALQTPLLYESAGFDSAPSEERLRNIFIEKEHLILWRMVRKEDGYQCGYCGWSDFAGPAYVFFVPADENPMDLVMVSEALELIGVTYFQMTPAEDLFIYVDRPIEEEIHETLVESGFDPWEELPSIDNEKEAGYSMTRDTFEAYYGNSDGDLEP